MAKANGHIIGILPTGVIIGFGQIFREQTTM